MEAPFCVWCAVCVTVFELVAVEVAVDVFVAVDPITAGIQIWISVPGTPRPSGSGAGPKVIETPAFVGEVCVDVAVELAACVVGAFWLRTCDCPAAAPPPVWVWSEACVTAFAFAASAVACEVLVCVTGAVSPGLLFRTTMFRFSGLT